MPVHLPGILFQNICGHLIWHLTALGTCWRHFCSHRWHMQRIRYFFSDSGLYKFTCSKSYWSSNAWSMDVGWNNSCHRVWILLSLSLLFTFTFPVEEEYTSATAAILYFWLLFGCIFCRLFQVRLGSLRECRNRFFYRLDPLSLSHSIASKYLRVHHHPTKASKTTAQ